MKSEDAFSANVRISRSPFGRDLFLICSFPDDETQPDRKVGTVTFLKDEATTMRNARLLAAAGGLRDILREAVVERQITDPELMRKAVKTLEFIAGTTEQG